MFNFVIGMGLMRALFGDKFDTPTFQKCFGTICFVLIALFITGAGYYRSHVLEGQLARLATEAVRGRAVVLDKRETFRSNTTHYEIVVEHVTSDGTHHRSDPDVEKAVFENARIGGSVPIVYLQSQPDTFFLVGQEPTEAGLSFMRGVFRVGLGCLALTLGLLVWQWPRHKGNGSPTSRVAPTPTPISPAPVSRIASGDGPAAFGKRR